MNRNTLTLVTLTLLLGLGLGAVAGRHSSVSATAHAEHGETAPAAAGHGDEHGHGDEDGHGEEGGHADEPREGHLTLSDEQINVAGIELATVATQALHRSLSLPGEIRFDEDRTAHLVPRAAGVVESVPVLLGQQVKAGELLAVIASPQISEQRSELAASQRRLELARSTFAREKDLWQEGISAEQDYLQARQALQEAEIAATNARQKVSALSGSVVLAGPTCDSTDIMYENVGYHLPLSLAVRDRLYWMTTGAYTNSYSSVEFNGFPPLKSFFL